MIWLFFRDRLCKDNADVYSLWWELKQDGQNLEKWGTLIKGIEKIPDNYEALRQILKTVRSTLVLPKKC